LNCGCRWKWRMIIAVITAMIILHFHHYIVLLNITQSHVGSGTSSGRLRINLWAWETPLLSPLPPPWETFWPTFTYLGILFCFVFRTEGLKFKCQQC